MHSAPLLHQVFINLKSVSDPQVSLDGKRVAYVLSTSDSAKDPFMHRLLPRDDAMFEINHVVPLQDKITEAINLIDDFIQCMIIIQVKISKGIVLIISMHCHLMAIVKLKRFI